MKVSMFQTTHIVGELHLRHHMDLPYTIASVENNLAILLKRLHQNMLKWLKNYETPIFKRFMVQTRKDILNQNRLKQARIGIEAGRIQNRIVCP